MAARIDIGNRRRGGFPGFLVRSVLALGLVAGVAGGQAAVVLYVRLAADLPPIPPFTSIRFGGVNTIRAAHGQVLAESFEQRRYLIPRERIPEVVVNAVVASEDTRFFEHAGLDLRGIARALWSNVRAGGVREGASTITQQLARALLLSNEKSLRRKVREAILARRLEDIYTKDQILTLYLNLIFMGDGTYGVQAAARVYYDKDVADLTLAEAAALATLPQSPGKVTPASNPAETRTRRDRVLRRMREARMISAEQEEAARSEDVKVAPGRDNLGDRAPVAATALLKRIKSFVVADDGVDLNADRQGITAMATVDLGLQLVAQEAVADAARALDRRQGWRGPIATLPATSWDDFARRNRAWLDRRGWPGEPPPGRTVLGLVTRAGRQDADVTLAPDVKGTVLLANLSWAIPYSEFPVKDATTAARTESARVSLDGKIDGTDRALRAGDVVLLVRIRPPPPVVEPPKGTRKGKGKPVAPEPPPAIAAAAPAGPLFALSQLPKPQAALLAMEPRSGYIQALVGGTDFDQSQVNRTESLRQTGSVVKPVYYSKAYDVGIPPSTLVSGAPFREGTWTPEGDRAVEDLTMYQALTQSENNCSLRVFKMVLDRVGLDGLNEWAARLGLSRPFQGFAAEGLGVDATPAELLRAYGTFALHGIRPDPELVKWVRDARGRMLVDNRSARDPTVPMMDAIVREIARPSPATRRAITSEAAWIVAHNLRNVAEEGTAKATRRLGRPVCGKTGTLPFDVWFVGWTHELAAIAWVGEDQRERFLGRTKASGGVFGADTALPAWLAFARTATAGRPLLDDLTPYPEGVVIAQIDPATGLLAQEKGMSIPHLKGTEPTEVSPEAGAMLPDVEAGEF